MGSNQSVRATHFQRPERVSSADPMEEDLGEEHHISISNKMVERLVEDATLSGGGLDSSNPKGDYKEKAFMEKLRCMDDSHTQRCGLTVDEVNSLVTRVEMRTANMVSAEPVCGDLKSRVIECYNTSSIPGDVIRCWDTIGAFRECVQEASGKRLHAHTQREARDTARRSRHVAHARDHALRDLAAT